MSDRHSTTQSNPSKSRAPAGLWAGSSSALTDPAPFPEGSCAVTTSICCIDHTYFVLIIHMLSWCLSGTYTYVILIIHMGAHTYVIDNTYVVFRRETVPSATVTSASLPAASADFRPPSVAPPVLAPGGRLCRHDIPMLY